MREMSLGFGLLVMLAFSTLAQASSTLRVGSQVLTAGDSTVRVTELLGKPSHKSRRRSSQRGGRRGRGTRVVTDNASAGEQWQYRRGDHVTTVTIIDGRVSDIQDRRR